MVKKMFYICSYGGSGSKMLSYQLSKYGQTRHIHSRKPPDMLEYVGDENGGNAYGEWFNGVAIPEEELKYYYVLYIYRNPSFAIPSRFWNENHLRNIQTNTTVKIQDVIDSKKDLYNIREFHDNYIKPNNKRNYKIYCVKYEDIFDKHEELSKLLEIGPLEMINTSTRKDSVKELDDIYSDLISEMKNNEFIIIS